MLAHLCLSRCKTSSSNTRDHVIVSGYRYADRSSTITVTYALSSAPALATGYSHLAVWCHLPCDRAYIWVSCVPRVPLQQVDTFLEAGVVFDTGKMLYGGHSLVQLVSPSGAEKTMNGQALLLPTCIQFTWMLS